ncbi:MAG: hypothetical protein R6X31_08060 [Anaerolineae bacterium]
MRLDLNQTDARQFLETFLDAEPTRLGAAFGERPYGLRVGHILSTLKLAQDVNERGDLVPHYS